MSYWRDTTLLTARAASFHGPSNAELILARRMAHEGTARSVGDQDPIWGRGRRMTPHSILNPSHVIDDSQHKGERRDHYQQDQDSHVPPVRSSRARRAAVAVSAFRLPLTLTSRTDARGFGRCHLGRMDNSSPMSIRPLFHHAGAGAMKQRNHINQESNAKFGAPTPDGCAVCREAEVSLLHVAKHEAGDFHEVGKVFRRNQGA